MTDYPRSRNGHVDTGAALQSNLNSKCPNCDRGKNQGYKETVSLEMCVCGYRVDYWGGGANDIAEAAFARRHREEERRCAEDEENER